MNSSPQLWLYASAYFLWFLTIGLSLVCAAAIRDMYRIVMGYSQWHRYTVQILDEAGILVLGLALLALIIVTEHLYRTAVPRGTLVPTACGVLALLLLILGSLHTILFLIEVRYGVIDPIRLGMLVAELGLATTLWWWRRRRIAQAQPS